MTRTSVASLMIASVLALTAAGLSAEPRGDRDDERWSTDAMPGTGVCFFQDAHYRGQHFCIETNDDLRSMPRSMRDKISSLRVFGNAGAVVFRDEQFKGPSASFVTDVSDLRKQGWNDQISSLRISTTASRWESGQSPSWGRETPPSEGACFYQDADFKGEYFCVPRGASYSTVPPEFNDKISSIRMIGAGRVLIFEDRDFDGRAAPLSADVANLGRGVWNDRISSIRVF